MCVSCFLLQKHDAAKIAYARVAELVDALASGASDRKVVGVQVPPRAQIKNNLCNEFSFIAEVIFLSGIILITIGHGVPKPAVLAP